MILYDGPSRIDGQPVVAIATGYNRPSKNTKTGPMVQVWILRADLSPISAVMQGDDVSICGSCRHRGTLGHRTCYVNIGKAPSNVWKSYRKGRYKKVGNLIMFGTGHMIRIGAYGDPAAIPTSVWQKLTLGAKGWTGYTHLWKLRPSLKSLLMASVDTEQEYLLAKSLGWRTFRVKPLNHPEVLPMEIVCPASEEMGHRTTCANCLLCNGHRTDDPRKDISILAHGVKRKDV